MPKTLCTATRPRVFADEPDRVPCANFAIDETGKCNAHHERTAQKFAERKRKRAIALARTLSIVDLETLVQEARKRR